MTSIIAHRGASRLEPENTIAAFTRAGTLGADGVELDVRLTADRHLVVHHDPYLADGRAVCATERADLPVSVPALAEALDACESMFVNIEIKNIAGEPDHDADDAIADVVMSELALRGGVRRWLISSFRYRTIERVRQLVPAARTAWLTTHLGPDLVERTAAGGHDAIHPAFDTVDAVSIRAAHAAGVAVNVWTCNDPDRIAELIAWGVDGICTDVPDVALAVRTSITAT